MPQYRHLAHLEDSRGIPGPRHGDLLDRAKPEGFGHCGRAVQLCEAKNVQIFWFDPSSKLQTVGQQSGI